MRKLIPLILVLAACKAAPPPVSLEETAREIHGTDFGLYFRDLGDGETLEMSAENSFLDPQARRISILQRVLEQVSAGRLSWETVEPDLGKMLREKDEDAAGNLTSRFGLDVEASLSPRACARLVEAFIQDSFPPEIQQFLARNRSQFGRFRTNSGKPYILICLSNTGKTSRPEEALHAYMNSKP